MQVAVIRGSICMHCVGLVVIFCCHLSIIYTGTPVKNGNSEKYGFSRFHDVEYNQAEVVPYD